MILKMFPYLFMIINITITTKMITMDQIKSTVPEPVNGRYFAMHDIISFLSMILRFLYINFYIVQYFLRYYVCFGIIASCLSHVAIYIYSRSLLNVNIYFCIISRRNVYLLDFFRHINKNECRRCKRFEAYFKK